MKCINHQNKSAIAIISITLANGELLDRTAFCVSCFNASWNQQAMSQLDLTPGQLDAGEDE